MNDDTVFGGASENRGDYTKLAQWLQSVMQPSTPTAAQTTAHDEQNSQLELVFADNYHLSYYQQLPDFIMALLNNESTSQYAPLLYHLVGCQQCHAAYVDLYDSMRAAVQPIGPRPVLGQSTRVTPLRMLSHLCRSLISQAEALLRQGRREHLDNDVAARSLLQLALRTSAQITQSTVRRQALQDLVRVATLFDGPDMPRSAEQGTHVYSPVMAGAGGFRRGKVTRRVDNTLKVNNDENAIIVLQSNTLEGYVSQQENTLVLHLQRLQPEMHGHKIHISILLGSLLEPVRWWGGNPRAIQSTTVVDEHGTLITPIGETELRLTNPEERNLLEAMLLLVEIKALV